MQQNLLKHGRLAVVCVCSLFVMLLFSACAGVAGGTSATTGGGTITGSVVSVNTSARSVTLNVNGQQFTVSGLTDPQISALQTQIGKRYSVQVQANGSNSYTINPGTDPTETDNATPQVNVTPESTNDNNGTNNNNNNGVNEPGSISFIGKVQSYNAGTLVVSLPGNQSLSMSAVNGQTEFKNLTSPQVNQIVNVDALANPNGSFMASKVEATDVSDQQDTIKLNTVAFKGVTTQAVGSNGQLAFKVGNKSYSFTISATTQLKDFTSAQAIGANQSIKVEVLYNGGNGAVQKVASNNG